MKTLQHRIDQLLLSLLRFNSSYLITLTIMFVRSMGLELFMQWVALCVLLLKKASRSVSQYLGSKNVHYQRIMEDTTFNVDKQR